MRLEVRMQLPVSYMALNLQRPPGVDEVSGVAHGGKLLQVIARKRFFG